MASGSQTGLITQDSGRVLLAFCHYGHIMVVSAGAAEVESLKACPYARLLMHGIGRIIIERQWRVHI